jgi:hypothetical protein
MMPDVNVRGDLLYVRSGASGYEVVVRSEDGEDEEVVGGSTSRFAHPRWTPDGIAVLVEGASDTADLRLISPQSRAVEFTVRLPTRFSSVTSVVAMGRNRIAVGVGRGGNLVQYTLVIDRNAPSAGPTIIDEWLPLDGGPSSTSVLVQILRDGWFTGELGLVGGSFGRSPQRIAQLDQPIHDAAWID